jgi:hypothetical protein
MRILLTLKDGRKASVPVASIADIVELEDNYLVKENTEDMFAFTAIYRSDMIGQPLLLVRESAEEIHNLLVGTRP